ncbi:peptidoglycan biosynthesis/recognition protein [Orbus hercynius]|uniref:Peptidoglycan biosynthesis/recognition protein n=1 Tax=Orbus hercynius TaxID=593135 RepID=A0A495RF26_9GAMM|nr:GNAT family N-acetyltransferase [Orbus hercynius]RKS86087.1 peptidoglycan biosynthesis/recognition protein [Orbus hercynius]
MQYLNQLEPNELVNNFLANPPVDFIAWKTADGLPMFEARFDLLTTLEPALRTKLMKLPLYRIWGKWLCFKTAFIGTTVSEYALLPSDMIAQTIAQVLKADYAKKYAFLIVKDLPNQSLLLDDRANTTSAVLAQQLKQQQFIAVEGQALAFVPCDFASIDEYLSRLSYSRRKNFRRKLKAAKDLDVRIKHSGDACFFEHAELDYYYQLYLNVYQQSDIHFDLLSPQFFQTLLQDKRNNSVIFTYYHNDQLIGYNICFIVNETLVDKYVGFVYPDSYDFNLYYVSWFYNLQFMLDKQLKYYIAGWTDPEVKSSLGAKFTFTQHFVHIRNPILRWVLSRLSKYFETDSLLLEREQHNKSNQKG